FGMEVSDDVDALDVNPRTLFGCVDDAHGVGRLVAFEARLYLAEGVALLRDLNGQRLKVLFALLGVVDAAGPCQNHMPEGVDIDRRQSAFNIDGAEAIARSLLDGVGDEEAPSGAVEICGCRDDTDVCIAILQV